jgi:hypothetical protein
MADGLIKFPNLLRRRAAYARQLAELSENGTISAFLKDLAQRLDKQAQTDELLAPSPTRMRRIRPVEGGTPDGDAAAAPLSRMTIDMLLDLVEIKISYMDVADLEDRRDLHILERCRRELQHCGSNGVSAAAITPLRRGRRPLNP